MSMIRKAVVALIAVSVLAFNNVSRAETPESVKEGQNSLTDQVIGQARSRVGSFVAALATPKVIDVKELQCLAKNIFYESASEPEEGKAAVGIVTLNRVEDGRFGSTVCKVIAQPRQFSWFGTKARKPSENDPRWIESKRVAEQLLSDSGEYHHLKVKYDDALYFHATHVRPVWSKQKKHIDRIGGHRFYGDRIRSSDLPRTFEL